MRTLSLNRCFSGILAWDSFFHLCPEDQRRMFPIFRKHAAEITKVFADASPKELRALEATLKKIGKRAESLGTGVDPECF